MNFIRLFSVFLILNFASSRVFLDLIRCVWCNFRFSRALSSLGENRGLLELLKTFRGLKCKLVEEGQKHRKFCSPGEPED